MKEAGTVSKGLQGASDSELEHGRRWWVFAVLAIAQLMIVLDATIVNIALPSAQHALHFSNASRQWVVTAYALAFGSLLLLGGRIGDLFGPKRVFITGAIGFGVASGIGGAAQTFAVLVAARGLQGVFAALMAPAALALVTTTFTDPRERGTAFGIWGGIAGGAGAIGLLLGGVLTQSLSWRWTLFINVGFAIPAALGGLALLRRDVRAARSRIDVPGTVTATAGLFALVYGFANSESHGWGSSTTIAFLAAGVALLIGFVITQLRATHPLLPLRVVLHRNRGGSFLTLGLLGIGVFSVFLFLTYYLQQIKGYSPITSGLAYLPLTLVLIASAGVANARLLPRTGPRPLVALGMLLSAISFALFAELGVTSNYVSGVLPGLLLAGLGLGLVFAPATDIAIRGVRSADAGVASALVNATNQIGGSLGIALLSTLSASAASQYLATRRPNSTDIARAAVHGYSTAYWWAAAIFMSGALLAGLLLRRPTAIEMAGEGELLPAGAF